MTGHGVPSVVAHLLLLSHTLSDPLPTLQCYLHPRPHRAPDDAACCRCRPPYSLARSLMPRPVAAATLGLGPEGQPWDSGGCQVTEGLKGVPTHHPSPMGARGLALAAPSTALPPRTWVGGSGRLRGGLRHRLVHGRAPVAAPARVVVRALLVADLEAWAKWAGERGAVS